MKRCFMLLILLSSLSAMAVDGLTISNSFQVDREGQVFRGREPKKLVTELAAIGISDVLIFKNEIKNEVAEEIDQLEALKISPHHIAFRWKDIPSIEEACGQVVEALNLIHKIKSDKGSIYFHCTAGEDRTGMLAGLYRMLEEHISMEKVFRTEMCARGYADGNPNKPGLVHGAIRKELTPLFIALAKKIEADSWELGKIKKKSCKGLIVEPTTLKCKI